MVGFLSCLFLLFLYIYHSHWSLHASQGFWIAQGSFHSWVLYWFYFIGCIVFIELRDIAHAAFLQLLAYKKHRFDGVEAEYVCWMYRELTHKTAPAHHQLSSASTVSTSLHTCRRQCRRRPCSVAPNFHAERYSPQTTGNINISNYAILNTFQLHTRRIWLFTMCPDVLNLLSVVNSTLTKIQSKTCTRFPTSNELEHRRLGVSPATTLSAVDGHIPWCCRTAARLHSFALGMPHSESPWDAPTKQSLTRLRCLKNTNISAVGSIRWAWRCTMTTCWR